MRGGFNKKILLLVPVIVLAVFIFSKKDDIHLNPSRSVYAGQWQAKHNASEAKVTVRDNEQYDIVYENTGCTIVFAGSIYDINLEKLTFKILKLDIDKQRSRCPYLNYPFVRDQLIFKFETLEPTYAKLTFFSIRDMENILDNVEGSDVVKDNIKSMIRIMSRKSGVGTQLDSYKLEYVKQ